MERLIEKAGKDKIGKMSNLQNYVNSGKIYLGSFYTICIL